MSALVASGALSHLSRIYSSGETKAREAAEMVAKPYGLKVQIIAESHENDRSSTGFLPAPAFEAMADRFFAAPDQSAEGWETARAAQDRIIGVFDKICAQAIDGDSLIVGHGAVGTLLYCHLAEQAISRTFDQDQAGSVFVIDQASRTPFSGWAPLETLFQDGSKTV